MAGILQGFFTTSSQFKKEEKKRDATSSNLTSSQQQSSSHSTMEGQQQATFKPSFKHPYTQLDTLSTEKSKKKQQKQLPEVKEFQTSKSEQQEQSDALAMIIAELSQQVESLKTKTGYAMQLQNNELTLNQKLQTRFEKEIQEVRDEVKDLREQLTEHFEKSEKTQEQPQHKITAPEMMELEQNGHSLSFHPSPAKQQQISIRNNTTYVAALCISIGNAEPFVEKQRIYWITQIYQEKQAIKRQRQKIQNLRRMQNRLYYYPGGRMYKRKISPLERFDLVPEYYVSMRSILLNDLNYLDKHNLQEGKPATRRKGVIGVQKGFLTNIPDFFHKLNQVFCELLVQIFQLLFLFLEINKQL